MSAVKMLSMLLVSTVLAWPATTSAAERNAASMPPPVDSAAEEHLAPVRLDGSVLFRVRGTSSYPAERRAAEIASRIRAAARDSEFRPDALRTVDAGIAVEILAGDRRLMAVFDADAQLEHMSRKELVLVDMMHIREAIEEYRAARQPRNLLRGAIYAVAATAALAIVVTGIAWLSRRLSALLERRFHARIHSVGIQSFQIVRAERIWEALRGTLHFGRSVFMLVIILVYLQFILGL
ncbi:MAG TPA: mechanosensitive ion channel family protein, partial [Candidatus Methylomirabilis sp.]|nr:mechanosensitive ion channel family protein [Candidatus Methylomirabilis sp.]